MAESICFCPLQLDAIHGENSHQSTKYDWHLAFLWNHGGSVLGHVSTSNHMIVVATVVLLQQCMCQDYQLMLSPHIYDIIFLSNKKFMTSFYARGCASTVFIISYLQALSILTV